MLTSASVAKEFCENSCRRRRNSQALLAQVFMLSVLSIRGSAQPIEPKLPTLTRADEIRRLTPEEAAKGYPVRIRGVVTMDAPAPDFVVQDSSAGIYVEGDASRRFTHTLEQMVEVVGVTGPGKFAPVIRERDLRVLGPGPLPAARLFAFSELADGQQDSQWVQVRGIVRSASIDRTSWQEMTLALRVASAGGEFNVRVPIAHELNAAAWVDREVLIEAVCGSLYNASRQLTGILLYVPRLDFIKTEAQARDVPLSGLLRFSPGEGERHRVRVRGIVEEQQLGSALFLQGEGVGLRVLTPQDTRVEVGDMVEVIGFPAMGESAPILEDAAYRRLGHRAAPQPVTLDLDRPWEQYDGALVTTEAKLLNRNLQLEGLRLVLQRGDLIFDATLTPGVPAGELMSVPLNSEVRITGVCLVRSGGLWRTPQAFRILLRSAQDAMVLREPSWWTLHHALWLLGMTCTILLIVMAWMVVLRRRVHDQMETIRQKLRSSAVLEERNRIARELHDTLEQELAGITLQLDLAVDCFQRAPRVAQQAVEVARNMSRHSMVEARRSVWDLRCQLLEDGDLVSALTQIVEPLSANEDAHLQVRIEGKPVRLPGRIEMNLLRIGQEAVANAVKHGRAKEVSIELRYASGGVCLTVADDGSGFAADQPDRTGHFGIQDMRERAQSMGSRLNIESKVDRGTTISVEVHTQAQASFDEEHQADTYSCR
jgi:signal transduction histidine kinase